MLAIKLSPRGKKHHRTFRLVVQERRSKLNGKFIDDLGWYDPHENKFEVNKEKASHWLDVGAKPTITAAAILKKSEIKLPEGIQTFKTYTKNKKQEEPQAEEKTEEKTEEKSGEEASSEEAPTEEAPAEEKGEAEAQEQASEEAPTPEAPVEETKEEPKEEPKEEVKEETKEEAPAEEASTEKSS